ncbi:MAG TPA: dienelactone hydrolase family protein [Gemmatimonadaceae bacterium]|nr:dienelactone hydrolase family protein [Gemmatimonadaceae bacterium]
MVETALELPTSDGTMPVWTYRPHGDGAFPAVIFYMDGVAIRPVLFEMARRLASHGYYVALPDLFYRAGRYKPFDGATVFSDEPERARLMTLIRSVTSQGLATDTDAILAHFDAEPAADGTHVGTVGYCMGGSAALSAAGRHPECVLAAASYHGGRLATDQPDSPHLLAPRMRARVYVGYAENDNGFQEPQRELLERALTAAGVPHEIVLYHGAHGFTMADLPVYNHDEAERHWTTMLALFGATLGGG